LLISDLRAGSIPALSFYLAGNFPAKLIKESSMKKLNPEYIDDVVRIANGCPYFTHLGMRIIHLKNRIADVEMDLRKVHLQAFGYAHGGAIASLIDTAAFWSGFCELEEDQGITTVDLNVNYLAPLQKGSIIARGRRIKLGRKLGLAEASVFDQDGKLVAHGTSTLIIVPGFGLAGGHSLPPKFLP
jgi:uncharacterized protein (TIGR00369 family)